MERRRQVSAVNNFYEVTLVRETPQIREDLIKSQNADTSNKQIRDFFNGLSLYNKHYSVLAEGN